MPYLIGSVQTADGTSVLDNAGKNAAAEKIDVAASALASVKSGMVQMVLESDVAREAFAAFPEGFVAAKTGTPGNRNGGIRTELAFRSDLLCAG